MNAMIDRVNKSTVHIFYEHDSGFEVEKKLGYGAGFICVLIIKDPLVLLSVLTFEEMDVDENCLSSSASDKMLCHLCKLTCAGRHACFQGLFFCVYFVVVLLPGSPLTFQMNLTFIALC